MRYFLVGAYRQDPGPAPLALILEPLGVGASSYYKYLEHHPEVESMSEAQSHDVYRRHSSGRARVHDCAGG